MSLNKVKKAIPAKHHNNKVGFILLLVAAIGLSFGVSYALTRATGTKAGVVTEGRLADKDGQAVYEVALHKDNIEPVNLLVKKGEYVQFNSKDGGQHQVVQGEHHNTEHSKGALDSRVFNGDEGYLVQFKESGSYVFHDNYDHDYTMTIIVYEPGADNTIR